MEIENPGNPQYFAEMVHRVLCFMLLIVVGISFKLQCLSVLRSKPRQLSFSKLRDAPQSVQPCTFSGPGCVLLATPVQLEGALLKSVVLVTEKDGAGVVGQIINKPSAWSMGEMAYESEHFQGNTLFAGGESGKDMAIMIHKYDLGGFTKHLGKGIYIGGSKEAREKIEAFQAHPKEFKFVFNSLHWAPGVLEKEIKGGKWDVCEVPVDMLVQQDEGHVTQLWRELRTRLGLPVEYSGGSSQNPTAAELDPPPQ